MKSIARQKFKTEMVIASAMFFAANLVHAAPINYEQSLQRGAVEDVTPQQKYRTAIREAGGGHKESLRECARAADSERRSCALEAKATYDRDMAEARMILRGRAPM